MLRNLKPGCDLEADRQLSRVKQPAGHPHWGYQLACKRRVSCCVAIKCATPNKMIVESVDSHLAPQSQASFPAPRLLPQDRTPTEEACVSQIGASVPVECNISSAMTISEGNAAADNHLLVLKMLAQQSSTAQLAPGVATHPQPRIVTTQQRVQMPILQPLKVDIEAGHGRDVTAALSMLPSPLPLDLTSTGMALQPQLGDTSLTNMHQDQQLLHSSIQQPHMQLQYNASYQQVLPVAHQQHMQLHPVQQQYPPQQLQQQMTTTTAALEMPPEAAPLPAQEAEHQQPQQAAAAGPLDVHHDRQQLADQTPRLEASTAAGTAQNHPEQAEGRDTADPSSMTPSGDASGQHDASAVAAAAVNPATSNGGSSGAAGGGGAGGGGSRSSKYGAKRAAALKRQGYTNSVPGPNGNGKSNFRGVFWDRKNSRWRAQVGYNNRKIFMGYFGEPAEAARAYDKKVVQLHGALAKTNFPLEEYADDLRAFNLQQQEQQLMSQQPLMQRPRRIRRKHRHNSDSSDMSDGAADDDYMDTDHDRGLPVLPGGGPVLPHASLAMYSQVPAGFSGVMPHAVPPGGVLLQQMGPSMGLCVPGSTGPHSRGEPGLVTGYPVDQAAAAAALGAYYYPAAAAAAATAAGGGGGHGDDVAGGLKGELSADVAAAVAAAAALAGVGVAGKEAAGGLKRKTPEGETMGDDTTTAAAVDGAAEADTAQDADAADKASGAGVSGTKAATEAYTEQLPTLPEAAVAAEQQRQQHHVWDQGAVLPAHRYSWTGGSMDASMSASLPPYAVALQRHSSTSIKQYSWHQDDVSVGGTAGRASSPPTWLPTPPPHLTWQDHMKNLEASLINAGKKDVEKDGQERDSNREPHDGGAARPGDNGGFNRGAAGSSGKGMAGAGYANRWQRLLACLSPSDTERVSGLHKGSWRQQQHQPVDTDGLSALLAIAAAAEANDTGPSAATAAEGLDAGADALAGLLSIAAAAGASNAASAAEEGGSVVLTKEQEKEWLYLTGSLAAAMSGSVSSAVVKNSADYHMTAELLAVIRVLAKPFAPPAAAAAEQQGGNTAASGTDAECGLPLEVLKTVEHWMLDPKQQQQQHHMPGVVDHDVSLAEALACASETGLTAEARQMYMLVLYQVLCRIQKQLKQQQQQQSANLTRRTQEQEAGEEFGGASLSAVTQAVAQASVDNAVGLQVGRVASPGPAAGPAEHLTEEQQEMSLANAAPAVDGGNDVTPSDAAAAAVVVAAASQGLPSLVCSVSNASAVAGCGPFVNTCGDLQQFHTSSATVVGHHLADPVTVGNDVAEAAAVVQISGGSATDHVSPGAAGRMSRWGSGTEGVMDLS